MEEDKILVLKVNGTTYRLDVWNIKYDFEKIRIIISGMDYNSMYYQIKLKKLETIEENLYQIIMKGN